MSKGALAQVTAALGSKPKAKKRRTEPPVDVAATMQRIAQRQRALHLRVRAGIAELEHTHFSSDYSALHDLAVLLDYLRQQCPEGMPVHSLPAELQALRKWLRQACTAKTPQAAHEGLRRATAAGKAWELGDLARHGLHFAMNEAKPQRKPDALQSAIVAYLRKHPEATAREVWDSLSKRPPRGVDFIGNARHPRFEVAGVGVQFPSFRNHRCAKARAALAAE